ncbi:hypothetical protein JI435_413540 [Parastagonospora nodorum SN15]|uniref:Uncharacterized protein n=1 Tax=Phaeosphaeria nodorum (strain SN15 / ATCC MYA-4574 / FGSC 10173) TaxID=321614 RepID=A0A7U2FAJ3_PHANO|nr:hypothetical protein JI435_413540 [Parastagonospora nodorum SN15]
MWVCVCDHGGYVDKRGLCMRSDVRSWWDLSTIWRTEVSVRCYKEGVQDS